MKLIRNILRELSRENAQELLKAVVPQRDSKGRQLLELLQEKAFGEKELMEKLEMKSGAFYTLKSRLVPKVVHYYTNLNENKIRLLREEAARVSFIVLNNERMISLRFLKELEKKLTAYDMSSELAVVYKHLSRLHRFDGHYETYERAYQKHIGFSLAVSKAEDILYEYIYTLGYYQISKDETHKERLEDLLDELENTYELYESHRLYTLFHIVQHYHQCCFLEEDELKRLELEVELMVKQLEKNLEKYHLDPFYGVIRNLIPFLNFEYYVRINNTIKANFYLEEIVSLIEFQFKAHLWGFFITQFILSLMHKLKNDGDLVNFLKPSEKFRSGYFVEQNETSHLVIYFRYRAFRAFYEGDYSKAALEVNKLRNISSFKTLPFIELELKLFQAFMYALSGDGELYLKLVASAKRQSAGDKDLTTSVKNFCKVLFVMNKNSMQRVDEKQLIAYWKKYNSPQGNPGGLFDHLYLNEKILMDLLKN